MTNENAEDKNNQSYSVVGRSSEIDLSKYTIRIFGRDLIDYDKLKQEDPELYQKLLNAELGTNT